MHQKVYKGRRRGSPRQLQSDALEDHHEPFHARTFADEDVHHWESRACYVEAVMWAWHWEQNKVANFCKASLSLADLQGAACKAISDRAAATFALESC